jgi:hypothetical protein
MSTTYISKREYLVTYYVRSLPNLGTHSTQQGESGNFQIKMFTEKQRTLEQAIDDLARAVRLRLAAINATESSGAKSDLRLTQTKSSLPYYSEINPIFSKAAIQKVYNAYEDALNLTDSECTCDQPIRFGLPCCHDIRAVLEKTLSLRSQGTLFILATSSGASIR